MTTPMSLPLTPDEPTSATASLPPIAYTTTPIFTPSSVTTPIFASHTPSSVPLTPESLVSPQSSCDGRELDEVLSYFADSTNDVACQDFSTFPSADTANYSSHIYHDSEYTRDY